MTYVSEKTIDEVVARLEKEGVYEKYILQLQQDQPVAFGWLFSENFDLFTRSEREYLIYLVLVIYLAAEKSFESVHQPDEEALSLSEEANWQLLSSVKAAPFHEKLNIFFETSTQEDLLAFAEDALSDVEDDLVTSEGRDALFVVLKTLIDCWTREETSSGPNIR